MPCAPLPALRMTIRHASGSRTVFAVNILSFNDWAGSHDTAAALVCDGVLVAAAEEERFSRRKHDGATPVRAVEFCLRQAGIRMSDVDLIAFPGRPFRTGRHSEIVDASWEFLLQLRRAGALRRRAFVHRALLSAYRRLPFTSPLDDCRLRRPSTRPSRDPFAMVLDAFAIISAACRRFGSTTTIRPTRPPHSLPPGWSAPPWPPSTGAEVCIQLSRGTRASDASG